MPTVQGMFPTPAQSAVVAARTRLVNTDEESVIEADPYFMALNDGEKVHFWADWYEAGHAEPFDENGQSTETPKQTRF